MNTGGTLSQRSSFDSIAGRDNNAQIWDTETGRPLLDPSGTEPGAGAGAGAGTIRGEEGQGRTSGPRGRPSGSLKWRSRDNVLVIRGVRVQRGDVLCGVFLVALMLLAVFLGIPTVLARQIYKDSAYTERPNPIACHSHNDYWRKEPLFSALKTGCIGIEADVWLHGDDLLVAHEFAETKEGLNFTTLYVDPLVKLLEQRNTHSTVHGWTRHGVYESDPAQTLILVIDLKSESNGTWPLVHSQLQPLRDRGWLTHARDGVVVRRPVTVVGSGETDFRTLVANTTYRDAFFDAPLDALEGSPYDATNSYYASVSFNEHLGLGLSLTGVLSAGQVRKIRRSVAEAHSRGLKARYWGAPDWALNVRGRVWKTLSDEGVDLVNVDDLQSFRDWAIERAGHSRGI